MNSKKVVRYGMLVALAMVLSYAEAQIPAFFAVPGMKLGLTNLVVLLALYLLGDSSAMVINVLRIILVSVLFGSGVSFAYSLAGGLLSGGVMIALKRTGWFSMTTVSVAGGIAHNVGQVLVAMALLQTRALAWYLLILWFSGLASGAVIGIVGAVLCKRMKKLIQEGAIKL